MQSRRELSPPPELHSRSPRTASSDPQAPLQRISIELSRRCNLACAYCYSEAAPTVATGLDDGDVRALVSEAFSCGARLVSIVGGGEPLLRVSLLKDGESCIDHANALGCYCLLYTNCTLVDRAAADWLGLAPPRGGEHRRAQVLPRCHLRAKVPRPTSGARATVPAPRRSTP